MKPYNLSIIAGLACVIGALPLMEMLELSRTGHISFPMLVAHFVPVALSGWLCVQLFREGR